MKRANSGTKRGDQSKAAEHRRTTPRRSRVGHGRRNFRQVLELRRFRFSRQEARHEPGSAGIRAGVFPAGGSPARMPAVPDVPYGAGEITAR